MVASFFDSSIWSRIRRECARVVCHYHKYSISLCGCGDAVHRERGSWERRHGPRLPIRRPWRRSFASERWRTNALRRDTKRMAFRFGDDFSTPPIHMPLMAISGMLTKIRERSKSADYRAPRGTFFRRDLREQLCYMYLRCSLVTYASVGFVCFAERGAAAARRHCWAAFGVCQF